MDHGFSFPLDYFEKHDLPLRWRGFLVDSRMQWLTHEDDMYVCFVREGLRGKAAARMGNPRWRRVTERRARTAKSVFHFNVQGLAGHSTHAGLSWLLYLWEKLQYRLHFWPFDGWSVLAGSSAIAEVYPALWNKAFPAEISHMGTVRQPTPTRTTLCND